VNSQRKEGGQGNNKMNEQGLAKINMDLSITASESESCHDAKMEGLMTDQKVQAMEDYMPMQKTYKKKAGNRLKTSWNETMKFRS
jgi:hypothetical protein